MTATARRTGRHSADNKPKRPPSLTRVKNTAASVAKAEARLTDMKERRDGAIIDAFAAGVGTRQIAAATGLSNSGVRKIVGVDTS
jgi:hypothetical protein